MIVLDTDVLIEILDKKSKKGDKILEKLTESGKKICTTSINMHEILYGLYKQKKRGVAGKVKALDALTFSKEDATISSKLEAELEKKGKPVARLDCMIAAIVIGRNAKLCTLNLKHFTHFERFGLKIFDVKR
jgi:predicted nucleic acid-binding protein